MFLISNYKLYCWSKIQTCGGQRAITCLPFINNLPNNKFLQNTVVILAKGCIRPVFGHKMGPYLGCKIFSLGQLHKLWILSLRKIHLTALFYLSVTSAGFREGCRVIKRQKSDFGHFLIWIFYWRHWVWRIKQTKLNFSTSLVTKINPNWSLFQAKLNILELSLVLFLLSKSNLNYNSKKLRLIKLLYYKLYIFIISVVCGTKEDLLRWSRCIYWARHECSSSYSIPRPVVMGLSRTIWRTVILDKLK